MSKEDTMTKELEARERVRAYTDGQSFHDTYPGTDGCSVKRFREDLRALLDSSKVEVVWTPLSAPKGEVVAALRLGRDYAEQMPDHMRAAGLNVFADFLIEFINRADGALSHTGGGYE